MEFHWDTATPPPTRGPWLLSPHGLRGAAATGTKAPQTQKNLLPGPLQEIFSDPPPLRGHSFPLCVGMYPLCSVTCPQGHQWSPTQNRNTFSAWKCICDFLILFHVKFPKGIMHLRSDGTVFPVGLPGPNLFIWSHDL